MDNKRNKNTWVSQKCKYDRIRNIEVYFKEVLKCFIEMKLSCWEISNRMFIYGFYKEALQFPFFIVVVLGFDTQIP